MIRYWLWRIATLIWCALPLKVGYGCATIVADVAYLGWRRGRINARQNMAVVLGKGADPGTVDRVARQSLRNYCKYVVDFIHFPMLKPEDIRRKVIFEGWANLDRALEGGKGAIFVGMHFGNWDLAAAAMTLRGYPLNVIAESFDPPRLNYIVQKSRIEKGLKVIPMETAATGVIRALRRNEMLALLIDRPAGNDGVAVRFFDGTMRIPSGVATLALRTGARVITGALVRLPNNAYRVLVDEYIKFQPTGALGQDTQNLTQSIVSSLENMVRQYPDQWYMFRSIFVSSK